MAAIPFYPGYKPDKPQPTHIPGYYPGKTMPKKYSQRGGFTAPIEYSFDAVTEFIDDFGHSVDLSHLPRSLKEHIIDDWQQNMKAAIKPKGIKPEDLDDYDLEALPGAMGLSVDLSPENLKDWKKRPEEKLKKSAKALWKSAVNMQDLDTMARKKLWKAMTYDTEVPGSAYTKKMGGVAQKSYEKRAQVLGGGGATYTNPLAISGQGLSLDVKKGIDESGVVITGGITGMDDAGDAVADAIIEFQARAGTVLTLDKEHDKVLSAMKFFIKADLDTATGLTVAQQAVVDKTLAKIDVSNVISSPTGADAQMGYVAGKLKKIILEGTVAAKTVREGGLSGEYFSLEGTLNTLREGCAKTKDKIITARGVLSGKELARLEKVYTPVIERIEELEKIVGTATYDTVSKTYTHNASEDITKLISHVNSEDEVKARMAATALVNKLERQIGPRFSKRNLTGGDFLFPDYDRILLRDLVEGDLLRGELGKLTGDEGLKCNKLKIHASMLEFERKNQSADGLLNAWEKGTLVETMIWNRIPSKFRVLTPAYWTGEVMKRAHYFGLIVNEEHLGLEGLYGDNGMEASKFAKRTVKNIYKSPGRVFGNRFKLDVAGFGECNIFGGQHFEAIDRLNSMLNFQGSRNWTLDDIEILMREIDNPAYGTAEVFKRILSDPNASKDLYIPKLPILNETNDLGSLDVFRNQLIRFKKYLKENETSFGSGTNVNNGQFLVALITSLKARQTTGRMVSITKRYAGLLEKAWEKINLLQSQVMGKFGKVLTPMFYAKKAITEAITTGLIALVGLFSGGTGAVALKAVEQFIRPIIRFIVNKVGDFAGALWKGIKNGDIFYALEGFTKGLDKLVTSTLKIMLIPIVVILVISSLFFGTSLTSFTTVDPTKGNAGMGGGNSIYPPGENRWVKIVKDVYVKSSSGNEQKNPKEYTNDEVTTPKYLDVRYEITIIPKITISGASLGFLNLHDKASVRKSDGSATSLIEYNATLSSFEKASTITINIPEDGSYIRLQGTQYYDSLIYNKVTLDLPGIHLGGQDFPPSSISTNKSFKIGDFVSECPLLEYSVMTLSYSGYDAGTGHGRDQYWFNVYPDNPEKRCSFPIPYAAATSGCPGYYCAPTDGGICYDKWPSSNRSEAYGFALDVAPVSGDMDVYLPALGDINREWEIKSTHPQGSWGTGFIAGSTDGEYTIYFTHLASTPAVGETFRAGDSIPVSTLYTEWADPANIHLHIELEHSGSWVRPRMDGYLCLQ